MNFLPRSLSALLLALAPLGAQAPAPEVPFTFAALEVMVDPGGQGLAAWQVEIVSAAPSTKVVGVEGGESSHYAAAPYYDPKALRGGRIILARFSTDDGPPHRGPALPGSTWSTSPAVRPTAQSG